MTTKERIIREAISEVEGKLAKVVAILDSDPIGELIDLRIEGQRLLDENKGVEARVSPAFVAKIGEMAAREKALLKAANAKNASTVELIDQRVKLDMELRELNSELFFMDLRKNARK